MSDPEDRATERSAFGVVTVEASGVETPPARNTTQDVTPSSRSAADAEEGTTYRPPPVERPAAGSEPLRVRFETEE